MLLRASGDAIGAEVDVGAATGAPGDGGVRHGALLTAYADAAHDRFARSPAGPAEGPADGDDDALATAAAALRAALGDAGWVEAALTVAVFNGLVRTADASGIPLDPGVVSATADDRTQLGLDRLAGASNSDLSIPGGAAPHPARFGPP